MEDKNMTCGRCHKTMDCTPHRIEDCRCSKIELSPDMQRFLQKTRYNCLCNDCLLELEALVQHPPLSSHPMQEGVHFYKENGLFVFTELYHILRGYCCGSGCRHCAYESME